jgi:serine/threonine-protein kinase
VAHPAILHGWPAEHSAHAAAVRYPAPVARKALKPWSASWQEMGKLGRGGAGETVQVRAAKDGTVGVLKTLHRENDADRRRRMHREGEALRTLSHPGVPKFMDSNTSEFAATTPLYLVFEYIDGGTLEAHVERHGALPYEEAVGATRRLVEVVAYCHQRDFAHRDIKPDNVMLRDGNLQDPVLIDFGLSFNLEDDDPDMLTRTEQQIGNRFLSLPELHTPGADKRDRRSDLSSCCGILYYMLTGAQPMTLRDGEGRAPHERPTVENRLTSILEPARTRLKLLFGKGFQPAVADRFQHASELATALEGVLAGWTTHTDDARSAIERAKLSAKELALGRQAARDEIRERVATGLPIHEVSRGHMREELDSPAMWRELARNLEKGEHSDVFRHEGKDDGLAGFVFYLQGTLLRGTEDVEGIGLTLRCLPNGAGIYEQCFYRSSRIWVTPRRTTSKTHDRAPISGYLDCDNRGHAG